MKTQLGGDRIGSGNKQEISLKNYSRSTHDLSYIWRSSMASGTLVPFMSELALPGDTFDIDLNCDVKTLPTTGPLFGSYKVQLDVFECPVRLYNGKLHMNMLNIGMDMSEVLLPQLDIICEYDPTNLTDNSQINSSSIFSYLGIRGVGRTSDGSAGNVRRYFNGIPYLGYWDIYKNYYANKQEEVGYVIHAENLDNSFVINSMEVTVSGDSIVNTDIWQTQGTVDTDPVATGQVLTTLTIVFAYNDATIEAYGSPNLTDIEIDINGTVYDPKQLFDTVNQPEVYDGVGQTYTVTFSDYTGALGSADWEGDYETGSSVPNTEPAGVGQPQLKKFDLENIDGMRMDILEDVRSTTAFQINNSSEAPYGLSLGFPTGEDWNSAFKLASQEGLGIKTYQSDLFNNWISTEWIDGTNGVNEVTAVSTAGNEFTIDALNLANKVYNMLNRIAISGGSYDDWLDAVYTHERSKGVENPVYHGSLIKELGFEEVVSNSASDVGAGGESTFQPLGELAGRGKLTGKHKGGRIKIKVSEPSYIMGIVSITPRIDYSQGNKWDTRLKSMDDLHKPALDEIGFEDLITDQMAWFDTVATSTYGLTYSTAGKQPAWINYMTNVNQCRGNFAVADSEMFMTLNRRYEQETDGIGDLTTYIDPNKYNKIFAYSQLDSQNFWVQIGNRIVARRKMSAKVIPNL